MLKIVKVNPPASKDIWGIRLLILLGSLALLTFLIWFFTHVRAGNPILFWLLTIGLVYKVIRIVHEWYHYAGVHAPVPPVSTKQWKVDILTTYCAGEPKSMIRETLTAMQAITYPHTTYLCDEADDAELKKFCEEIGVIHVTRTKKVNAKAGNINNALQQATGEICVVMDPDHIPVPWFLDSVLPYFEDEKVGFVQVVQAYYNRRESPIARGAAEQTFHFYGPMMMSMGSYGTAQAIGANCTFRRSALDSIGGHAAGLSEDMHTSMRLHAKGWKSVYVPEIINKGLVPATLASFYQQQLKWARGTFELLFEVYPRLFRNFTWRQKIHYFTLPLYYLTGVITLIDLAVPIIALMTSEVAWKVNILEFSIYFAPVFFTSLFIRQYAQRWLLEDHERGFHGLGGLLRIGTWWIYLIGFVYSIFRIKVPYIPTAKDDKPRNNFLLALPNIIACLASLAAVIYGLQKDWSEYAFFMAGFAMVNFCLMAFMVVISQERWIKFLYDNYYKPLEPVRVVYGRSRHKMYALLRNQAIALTIIGTIAYFSYNHFSKKDSLAFLKPPVMKSTGGFYTGIYLPKPTDRESLLAIASMEKKLNTDFSIVSIYQAWGPKSLEEFPDSLLHVITLKGSIPMITWEPWVSTFPEYRDHPDLKNDRKACLAIYDGLFDEYIRAYAAKIRKFGHPVFLRFAHEPDNHAYPWSPAGGNSPGEFIAAWRHVVETFEQCGVSNVTWVWNPLYPSSVNSYFPGGRYVDWVGITCLNYGKASYDGTWRSFEEIYTPYRKDLLNLYRPIMLAEFGSTSYGGDQAAWMQDALDKMQHHFTEIKGAVFFNSDQDKNWITSWRPDSTAHYIDWTIDQNTSLVSTLKNELKEKPYIEKPFTASLPEQVLLQKTASSPAHPSLKVDTAGNFTWMVDGQPFYIKGIAYNPGHDWRDGNIPHTKQQLEVNFERIREMGANTIRRYDPTSRDVNILNHADETGMKVMYGFWFDPKIDYYKDTRRVNEYMRTVEETIRKYKHHKSIVCWSIGNETWGLLKHTYYKPYLVQVRNSYLQMLEKLAVKIHEIDPERLVFSSIEHEETQLSGEIASFRDWCPSIDVMGINSYYKEQISTLDSVYTQHDSLRPYVVTEFGPRGYWKPEYSKMKDSLLYEDSDREKAAFYTWQWKECIEKNKGKNLGGIAYCWRDRFEGSNTWFGLTDFNNRLKPSYYALQQVWKKQRTDGGSAINVYIISPSIRYEANKTYEFTVYSDTPVPDGYHYEWHLSREDNLDYVKGIKIMDQGRRVHVTMPSVPTIYRLYVYVSDDKGNVYCASKPLAY